MKKTLIALAMVMASGSAMAAPDFGDGTTTSTVDSESITIDGSLFDGDQSLSVTAKYEAPKSCFITSFNDTTTAFETNFVGNNGAATELANLTLEGNKSTAKVTLGAGTGNFVWTLTNNGAAYTSGTDIDMSNAGTPTPVVISVKASVTDFDSMTDYNGSNTVTVNCVADTL